jgi:hypothetical protein
MADSPTGWPGGALRSGGTAEALEYRLRLAEAVAGAP